MEVRPDEKEILARLCLSDEGKRSKNLLIGTSAADVDLYIQGEKRVMMSYARIVMLFVRAKIPFYPLNRFDTMIFHPFDLVSLV